MILILRVKSDNVCKYTAQLSPYHPANIFDGFNPLLSKSWLINKVILKMKEKNTTLNSCYKMDTTTVMTNMEKLIVLLAVMQLGLSASRKCWRAINTVTHTFDCLNSHVFWLWKYTRRVIFGKKISWQTWNIKYQSLIFAFSGLDCSYGFTVQKQSLMYLWLTVNQHF